MTSGPSPSRLAPARRRAHVVKLASVGAAALGFGVVAVLARGAHPGAAGSGGRHRVGGGLDVSSRISQEAQQSGDFFGSGSVTPSQSSARAAGLDPHLVSTHRFRAMGCEVVVGGASDADAAAVERLFADARGGTEPLPADVRSRAPQRVGRRDRDRLAPARGGHRRRAARGGRDRRPLRPHDRGRARRGRLRPQLRAHRAGDPAAVESRSPRAAGGRSGSPASLVRRPPGLRLDLNGVVKGRAVDDALALVEGAGFVSAGGDLATRGELVVALPGGGTVTLHAGALATSGRQQPRRGRGQTAARPTT